MTFSRITIGKDGRSGRNEWENVRKAIEKFYSYKKEGREVLPGRGTEKKIVKLCDGKDRVHPYYIMNSLLNSTGVTLFTKNEGDARDIRGLSGNSTKKNIGDAFKKVVAFVAYDKEKDHLHIPLLCGKHTSYKNNIAGAASQDIFREVARIAKQFKVNEIKLGSLSSPLKTYAKHYGFVPENKYLRNLNANQKKQLIGATQKNRSKPRNSNIQKLLRPYLTIMGDNKTPKWSDAGINLVSTVRKVLPPNRRIPTGTPATSSLTAGNNTQEVTSRATDTKRKRADKAKARKGIVKAKASRRDMKTYKIVEVRDARANACGVDIVTPAVEKKRFQASKATNAAMKAATYLCRNGIGGYPVRKKGNGDVPTSVKDNKGSWCYLFIKLERVDGNIGDRDKRDFSFLTVRRPYEETVNKVPRKFNSRNPSYRGSPVNPEYGKHFYQTIAMSLHMLKDGASNKYEREGMGDGPGWAVAANSCRGGPNRREKLLKQTRHHLNGTAAPVRLSPKTRIPATWIKNPKGGGHKIVKKVRKSSVRGPRRL